VYHHLGSLGGLDWEGKDYIKSCCFETWKGGLDGGASVFHCISEVLLYCSTCVHFR
jgi:hypothetical protein